MLDVFGVCAAVYKDFLDAVGSQKLEGVFDHRNVDQRKEALGVSGSAIEGREGEASRRAGAYPWCLEGEWPKPVLERVGQDDGLEHVFSLLVGARLGGLLCLACGSPALAALLRHWVVAVTAVASDIVSVLCLLLLLLSSRVNCFAG